MGVYVFMCICVWLIWWFGGQPKQTGMAFVAWEGGCTASVSYTVVANTQMPHTQTHAHTRYANDIACGFSDAPWAFPVHLWWQNDHSAPYNLSRAMEPPHTYRNTAPEALQKAAAPLQESSMNLVCLIDSIPDNQTNKPCCSELSDTFSLQHLCPSV